jgi:hypothetical protein
VGGYGGVETLSVVHVHSGLQVRHHCPIEKGGTVVRGYHLLWISGDVATRHNHTTEGDLHGWVQ